MIFSPKKLSLSLELFPPEQPHKLAELTQTCEQLNRFHPDFFSVTFGAAGNSQTRTLETVEHLVKKSFPLCPHLSTIHLTEDKARQILDYYQTLDIHHLIIIRGDQPISESIKSPTSPIIFNYAEELIQFIHKNINYHFHLHVAAYPEFHPEAKSTDADLFYFQKKVNAGTHSAITQYFFNSDAYFRFVEYAYKKGISTPIIPGIMPIINYPQLERFSKQCGAEIPLWIRKRCEDFIKQKDELGLKAFGIEVIVNLCETLLKGGAPGLHFYTLNRLEPTDTILKSLNHFYTYTPTSAPTRVISNTEDLKTARA